MDTCSHCWSRYMEAMELSRRTTDRMASRLLVREAYVWLTLSWKLRLSRSG